MQGPVAPRRFRMNRPTDDLRADHGLAAAGLQLLAAIADHVRHGGRLPPQDAAIALRFLRDFVVAVHLRKESDVVWPALAMRGEDRVAELVGELLRLQDEVTELTHSLILFWEPDGELTAAERAGFAATVDAVHGRLQRMRELEEQQLFSACDRDVPADDQLDWLEQFRHLARERGSRAGWQQMLAPLCARWCAS
jgi:hemerythrin-like domain-containing protein